MILFRKKFTAVFMQNVILFSQFYESHTQAITDLGGLRSDFFLIDVENILRVHALNVLSWIGTLVKEYFMHFEKHVRIPIELFDSY